MSKFKILLLNLIFSKKDTCLIFSSLYQTEEKYRDRYNDVNCEQHYHTERTKSNIESLVKLRDIFDNVIKLKE